MKNTEYKECFLSKRKKVQTTEKGKFLLLEKKDDGYNQISLTEREAYNLFCFLGGLVIDKATNTEQPEREENNERT